MVYDGNKITYDEENGVWSDNATEDIKIIYASLMLTDEGKKQWKQVYEQESETQMILVDEVLYDPKTGEPVLGLCNQQITKNTFKKLNDPMLIRISLGTINNTFEGKNRDLSLSVAIGATAGHEIEHTTEENRDLKVRTLKLQRIFTVEERKEMIERKPEEVGRKIRSQSIDPNERFYNDLSRMFGWGKRYTEMGVCHTEKT